MAIPLPPWLTREYDYASGIRRTGEVIARNLQRRRELEIEAVRAAAAAQQAQALERYRQAQMEEMQRKSQLEEDERLDMQNRMNEFRKRIATGSDAGTAALELGVIPPSGIGGIIASQEATRRAQLEAQQPQRKTADEVQRENIMRLWKAAQEPDEMQMGATVPSPFGGVPIALPKPSAKKQETLKELEVAEKQAGLTPKSPVEGAITQQQREELRVLRDRLRPILSKIAKNFTLEAKEVDELRKIQKREAEILNIPMEEEAAPNPASPESSTPPIQKTLPIQKKPYYERRTVP